MTFLLVPDSFKGTLDSREICDLMARALRRRLPDAEILSIPVADGGEGSVEAFLAALGGERVGVRVAGPFFDEMEAFYGRVSPETAVVEMAACAGLPLVAGRENPLQTTTYGVGQLVAHAAAAGCREIIVGLGGSCTNDGGAGAAAALGIRFLDGAGQPFVPVGGTLEDIAAVDPAGRLPDLAGVRFLAMCDIDNPLTGPQGAAPVFGPQKGADPAMVERLDAGLAHLARLVERDLGIDMDRVPGAGAAGGMGGGMLAFLGAELRPGIQVVLDLADFDRKVRTADLVLTGEGRIDGQSLRGKVVVGVAERARRVGVPVVAVVGSVGDDVDGVYERGVSAIFSINRRAEDFSVSRFHSRENLEACIDNLARLLRATGRA